MVAGTSVVAAAGSVDDAKAKKTTPTETNYITPAGFRRLAEELTFLRTKKRPEVVGALSDAAAEGDRSENAEYITASVSSATSTAGCAFSPSGSTSSDRRSVGAAPRTASSSAPPSPSRTRPGQRRPIGSSAPMRPTAPPATSPGGRRWGGRCWGRPRGIRSPCGLEAGTRELTVGEISYPDAK